MSGSSDNVIYVSFGRNPSEDAPAVPNAPPVAVSPRPRDAGESSQKGLFSRDDAARLLGVSLARLQQWSRVGLAVPSEEVGIQRFYSFEDMVSLRTAKRLLEEGVTFRVVRESVASLRAQLPAVLRPLTELRIVPMGRRLGVRDGAVWFDPMSGQLAWHFEAPTGDGAVVHVLQQSVETSDRRRQSYEHYLDGCRLDDSDATLGQAEEAYRRAIACDPTLASAYTNLGNVRFRLGANDEAEQYYQAALDLESGQPEAAYNLGFLAFSRGDAQRAVRWFRRALERDPAFSDAHFNLAMSLERLGEARDAVAHWETFLQLDPSGPWNEVARVRLKACREAVRLT